MSCSKREPRENAHSITVQQGTTSFNSVFLSIPPFLERKCFFNLYVPKKAGSSLVESPKGWINGWIAHAQSSQ
jgi:hypothetical protein